MRLSKRETYIAAAAIAAVALLALDRYVVTPVLESGEALEAEKEQLVDELANAQRLFERRQMLGGRWDELTAGGLTDDPEEAESLILHAMRDWAAEAGLSMSSLKPERDESDGKAREITIATDPPQAVIGDWEAWGDTPITVSVLPQAVRVIAPDPPRTCG